MRRGRSTLCAPRYFVRAARRSLAYARPCADAFRLYLPRFLSVAQSLSLALLRRFVDWPRNGADGVHENVVLAPSSSPSVVANRVRRKRVLARRRLSPTCPSIVAIRRRRARRRPRARARVQLLRAAKAGSLGAVGPRRANTESDGDLRVASRWLLHR